MRKQQQQKFLYVCWQQSPDVSVKDFIICDGTKLNPKEPADLDLSQTLMSYITTTIKLADRKKLPKNLSTWYSVKQDSIIVSFSTNNKDFIKRERPLIFLHTISDPFTEDAHLIFTTIRENLDRCITGTDIELKIDAAEVTCLFESMEVLWKKKVWRTAVIQITIMVLLLIGLGILMRAESPLWLLSSIKKIPRSHVLIKYLAGVGIFSSAMVLKIPQMLSLTLRKLRKLTE